MSSTRLDVASLAQHIEQQTKRMLEQDSQGSSRKKRQCNMEVPSERCVEQLNDEFRCPISMELISDPVVGSDGRLYERSEIERWLSVKGASPVTQAPMVAESLMSCHPVRNAIEALVSSGSVPPAEEALFQVRRGKLAKSRGNRSEAIACFTRAIDLGSTEAKYLYAVSLLEDAAPSCREAARLLARDQPFRDFGDFAGQYVTTFCDELIEIMPDGSVLFNGERHPDNIIKRRDATGTYLFNQWELDVDSSKAGRLLWLRPTSHQDNDDAIHRIWWFAYEPDFPPNCYEQRNSDNAPVAAISTPTT
ncbi:hypothetical protein CTAYLR_006024 [Chrysophaeum taylorii]|uniref:U-box domain-containing protein n=1 Tax=Chrysophaeum taylorii TaxID=2483200 RepID=A0AAD7UJQ2_9STRA|nr:hypothetical protein CTAYLR_006024 [Chrysophaeum taylorii]